MDKGRDRIFHQCSVGFLLENTKTILSRTVAAVVAKSTSTRPNILLNSLARYQTILLKFTSLESEGQADYRNLNINDERPINDFFGAFPKR